MKTNVSKNHIPLSATNHHHLPPPPQHCQGKLVARIPKHRAHTHTHDRRRRVYVEHAELAPTCERWCAAFHFFLTITTHTPPAGRVDAMHSLFFFHPYTNHVCGANNTRDSANALAERAAKWFTDKRNKNANHAISHFCISRQNGQQRRSSYFFVFSSFLLTPHYSRNQLAEEVLGESARKAGERCIRFPAAARGARRTTHTSIYRCVHTPEHRRKKE